MHSWSLVTFTLLTQSAVGLVWTLGASHWTDPQNSPICAWGFLLALLLCGVGLAAALGHLGTPRQAPHAVRNFRQSWLSREVVSVGAFTATVALLVYLSMARSQPFHRLGMVEAACGVLGLLALYTMVRVYRVRTVPMWNSLATPLEFFGSALILGGLLGAMIVGRTAADPTMGPMIRLFLLGGLTCKLAALGPSRKARRLSAERSWYEDPPAAGSAIADFFRIGLVLVGVVLAFLATSGFPGGRLTGLATALMLCLAAECWGRWRFFREYRRVGL
ncbi:MAG: DmsC/YnfH family molybdoenzyme membrane anchor subunit [Desulfosarcina sp.]